MLKWADLSHLLSVSLRLLQTDEVHSWAQHVAQRTREGANRGAHRANGAVDSTIDDLLGALHLQRRSSGKAAFGQGLLWAGLGAALAAGALGATQIDRKQLRQWVGEAGGRLGGAASRSAQWAERQALDEWLDVLSRVGLQPRPRWPERALRAAAWVGAGTALGAGAVALAWALGSKRHETKSETATVATAPGASAAAPEVATAASDQPSEAVGDN
jgi:hypothetical protein